MCSVTKSDKLTLTLIFFTRALKKRSSLIYNTSARHERQESDASAALATWVRHERRKYDTNAKRVKNYDFDNDTSKNIFTPLYLLYGKWKTTRRGTI